jgi:hypothetical protein
MASSLLKKCEWEYGSRSDCAIYDWPYFIDINWKKYNWMNHWLSVKKHQPVMAMVADYLAPSTAKCMSRQVEHISYLGVRPLVCPKFHGAVADIPQNCVVAISVPTGYAGFLPLPDEVGGRQVHLLGGHPDQIAYLKQVYRQSEVISVDCSVMFLKAEYGAYWDAARGDWIYTARGSMPTDDLVEQSCLEIARYLSCPFDRRRANARRIGVCTDMLTTNSIL